jgi:prepilin-type N-terminal cleavage/methylation domain-containing protein
MQSQRRQKGFTLVELLVVIAIIAILATVSIIGYTQFIKRANMSADQQAVTQMNTLLEGLDVTNEPDDVVDLWTYLNETGLDAEDYKPLSKDHYFFWDQSLNRILLVDKDNKVVFPKAYADAGMANGWYTLSGKIHLKEKPAVSETGEVAIASASDFIQTMADNAAGVSSMKLKGDINMMGASHGSVTLNRNFTLDGDLGGEKKATVSNLVSTEYATVGTTDIFVNKKYSSGLFGEITSGQILIKDIVFDGLIMGSYDIGSTGILAGIIRKDATVTLQNVTFKNCTIYGQNKVGLIAGGVYGKLILENVKVENCVVNASEGEAGMLFGMAYYNGKVEVPETKHCVIQNTVVNNVEYGLHEIVDVAGAKFITRVRYASGAPKVEKAIIQVPKEGGEEGEMEDQEYTATTRCATPATIGWFKKSDNNYAAVSDLYCAQPAIEVTTIAQMNANNRD